MCTVSFVPGLPGGGYLLASNRDESPHRGEALPPFALSRHGRLVVAPRDRDAGGTWIGVDEHGAALCVLNGDRAPAAPPPEDATSRGTLVLALLDDPRPDAVRAELERRVACGELRVRPFKLVVVEPGRAGREASVLSGQWDGARLAWEPRRGPTLFVSSTFRPDEVAAVRGAAFAEVLARGLSARPARDAGGEADEQAADAAAEALAEFHAGHRPQAPAGDAFCVCMHRPDARTVSHSLVLVTGTRVALRYQPGWPCEDREVHEVVLARSPRAGG